MSISFQTNKTGAAAAVCSTSTIKYNFSVARNSTVSNATFAMSKGSSTTASCTVAIYDQPNGGGSIIASVTLPASAFVSSSYPDVVFTFPANTTVTANTDYSLVISSATGCNGASAYSLKPGSFQVVDTTTGTVLNTGYAIAAAPAAYAVLTPAPKQTFAVSSANVSVATLSAAATGNKNYLVTAGATSAPRLDAAAALETTISATATTEAHMDVAATGDYLLIAAPAARALFFASTEPYLFVESDAQCAATASAAAQQNTAARASLQSIVATAAELQQQAGTTPKLYFATNTVQNLYIGPIRVTKAYIGSDLLIQQAE